MQIVVTAEEMQRLDHLTSEKIGIPSLLLMERAALETVYVLLEFLKKEDRIVVCAGNGNNGGDGLAIGRILLERGYHVDFVMPGNQNLSRETRQQKTILENLGCSFMNTLLKSEYTIIIDALFGVGLSRELTGIYADTVREMNEQKDQGAKIISIDIPSGISSNTGKILGSAIRADLTVTYEFAKAGHYFYPGKAYTGKLLIRSIGILSPVSLRETTQYFTETAEHLPQLLPKRSPDGNKGTFGKLLIVAGSETMFGAAFLAAKSALKNGAGMVKLLTHENNRTALQIKLPEALLATYQDTIDPKQIKQEMDWADVIVAGCGLSQTQTALCLMETILSGGHKKLVIDADGLNLIAKNEAFRSLLVAYERGKVILTPHPGEFCRLMQIPMEEYKTNKGSLVRKLADNYHCVVAGKDAATLVAAYDQESVFLNQTGNDGMATAGSGDVLAGLIGANFAMLDAFCAAYTGVLLHGQLGDVAAKRNGKRGVTASDMIEALGGTSND